MKNTIRSLVVLAALSQACSGAGCGSRVGVPPHRESRGRRDGRAKTLLLLQADEGVRRPATVGQGVQVELEETPSTGYRWSLNAMPPGAVDVLGTDWQANAAGVVGGAGRRTFSLRLKAPGAVRLELTLRRAWASEGAAAAAHHEFLLQVGKE